MQFILCLSTFGTCSQDWRNRTQIPRWTDHKDKESKSVVVFSSVAYSHYDFIHSDLPHQLIRRIPTLSCDWKSWLYLCQSSLILSLFFVTYERGGYEYQEAPNFTKYIQPCWLLAHSPWTTQFFLSDLRGFVLLRWKWSGLWILVELYSTTDPQPLDAY